MKNAASCDNWCELQNTPSTEILNAYCGLGVSRGLVCLRVGILINYNTDPFVSDFWLLSLDIGMQVPNLAQSQAQQSSLVTCRGH